MAAGCLLGVIELPGSPESASKARAYVREKLGNRHPALEDVTLLVSELVTNAILHSDSKDGGKVTLAIADAYGLIHVDVVDAGGRSSPRPCEDVLAEGGRGLMLVESLSHKWSVHEDDTGRTVWFEVEYRRSSQKGGPVIKPSSVPPASPSTSRGGSMMEPSDADTDGSPPIPCCRPVET
jgi:anti-sigma regulatory factor (Ser/Thr protein kinase)